MRYAAIAFLLGSSAIAADEVLIEAKVQGAIAVLSATTDGAKVVWLSKDDGLSAAVPPELLKDSKTYVVTGKPGTYRVIAISAIKDSPVYGEKIIVLGDAPPPTPPPQPPPLDSLVSKFQSAYAADLSSAKRGQLVNLMGLYSAATDFAVAVDEKLNDAQGNRYYLVKTSNELLGKVKSVGNDLLQPNVLVELRKVIAAEIASQIGTPSDAMMDSATRQKAVTCFSQIANALKKVK